VIILLLLAIALFGTAVVLITRGLIAGRLRTIDTLGQIGRYGFTGNLELEPPSGLRGVVDSLASGLGLILTDRLKLMSEDRLQKQLAAAGMYQSTPGEVLGYGLILAVGLPAVWIWLAVFTGVSTTIAVLLTIILALLGWFTPGFVIQRRAESRVYRIDRNMPELIDLLVVTVEAGLSLAAALQLAGERMKGPLGEELRIVLQEQRMGLGPVQALENMVTRCPTPSVEAFVRAMAQGQVLGVSVGQILRNLAIEMRKRRRAAAEQQAQKAPIKMLFPLILMIFPALFVVILGPPLISILHALGGA
jgi:tight adherence protein C